MRAGTRRICAHARTHEVVSAKVARHWWGRARARERQPPPPPPTANCQPPPPNHQTRQLDANRITLLLSNYLDEDEGGEGDGGDYDEALTRAATKARFIITMNYERNCDIKL